MIKTKNILGLDVGEKRIGVALANTDMKLTKLLETLDYQSNYFWENLEDLIKKHEIDDIVIGLPRGLNGQETSQTKFVHSFAKTMQEKLSTEVHWQDEALTSVRAQEILEMSGKPYRKSDIDAIAASLILSDYLENLEVSV